MAYTITWQKNCITWTYSGVLTGEDLLNSNFELFGDERFDDIRFQIVDLTAVERVEATESHMRKVAHLDMAAARSNPRVKIAVVTNSQDGETLSNTYDRYIEGKSPWSTQIFATLTEAQAWVQRESET
ncbi:MAG TPA: hypothetical protein DEA90_03190 [Opitutae bacterium]|nr:hypothetical protein [Puniceicoccaceae bacterium]HBR93149.1 hypothetical protein [Opitutae bacterium]|tara:strand:- start:9824 stop:10207 length:384 start_codon:yes stop_codon:yes gene_type:complete